MNQRRNCAMTGRESTAKIEVLPDIHSWVKSIPVCIEYKDAREQGKLRNMKSIEAEAHRLFYALELDPENKVLADGLTKLQQDVLKDIGHHLAASQQDKDSRLEEQMQKNREDMMLLPDMELIDD